MRVRTHATPILFEEGPLGEMPLKGPPHAQEVMNLHNFLNPIPKEIIYIIFFIGILLILIAAFIMICPNFLFGYYAPFSLGYLPWFGPAYTGIYNGFGFGGISPYQWNHPFLYSPFLGSMGWPWWNIYGGLWSYPYARTFGELLLIVPPAGDPIFIDEAATAILVEEALIATVSGFLDVALVPEELITLTDPILTVLAANPSLLPEFWGLYPDLAITNPDLYAAILLL